jgi:hypothetical protein
VALLRCKSVQGFGYHPGIVFEKGVRVVLELLDLFPAASQRL